MIAPADIAEIMDTDLADSEIEPYIGTAQAMVDYNLSGGGLPEDLKDEITKWLTAHLITVSQGQSPIEVEAGSVGVKFSDIYEAGLSSTTFGQTAMSLDPTGTLASVDGSSKTIKLKAVPE